MDIQAPTSIFSFVTGPAGTGKTFLAKDWAESHREAMLVSTTGISAINVGGTTLNAALRYFDTQSMIDAYVPGWIAGRLRKLRDAGTSWLILDEVSMLPAEQLTMLVRAIQDVNRSKGYTAENMRLTVVGDFAQLAPVTEAFAFESSCWPIMTEHTIKLTEIKRQSEHDFIEALGHVRHGRAQQALDYFGPRLQRNALSTFEGTTIKAKNNEVMRFNELQMDEVQGKEVRFQAVHEGMARAEWKLIPRSGYFRIGALVMVLANKRYRDTLEFQYVNGDLGTLVDATDNKAFVRLQRTQEIVEIDMVTRENLTMADSKRLAELRAQNGTGHIAQGRYEVIGRVRYMPLRAAWASTVHKSQGLSFDTVQVDIRNRFFQQPGMLYVALSRARTAAGLRIVGTPQHFLKHCTTNPKVVPWL